jgi:hypothetical protein
LIERLTGIDFNAQLVDTATGVGFFLALIISFILNIRDYRKK